MSLNPALESDPSSNNPDLEDAEVYRSEMAKRLKALRALMDEQNKRHLGAIHLGKIGGCQGAF